MFTLERIIGLECFIRPSGWMWIETPINRRGLRPYVLFHPPFGVDVD